MAGPPSERVHASGGGRRPSGSASEHVRASEHARASEQQPHAIASRMRSRAACFCEPHASSVPGRSEASPSELSDCNANWTAHARSCPHALARDTKALACRLAYGRTSATWDRYELCVSCVICMRNHTAICSSTFMQSRAQSQYLEQRILLGTFQHYSLVTHG